MSDTGEVWPENDTAAQWNGNDWAKEKAQYGLYPNQDMTPMASITGGLDWLNYKADHLAQQNPGNAVTLFDALKAYNGRTDIDPNGLPHSVNYANSILSRVGPGYGKR